MCVSVSVCVCVCVCVCARPSAWRARVHARRIVCVMCAYVRCRAGVMFDDCKFVYVQLIVCFDVGCFDLSMKSADTPRAHFGEERAL